jgi:hypothetical protein
MSKYHIEVEIWIGRGGQLRRDGDHIVYPDLAREGIGAWMFRRDGRRSYQVRHKFAYPEDIGQLCPWLVDSLQGIIHVMRLGGTSSWRYQGTPYEKAIDPEGITTEFVRCIDPTASGLVVRVMRTRAPEQTAHLDPEEELFPN